MSPSVFSNVASMLYALKGDCPAVAERNLLELLGVIAGLKNVVRLPVNDSDWPALAYYCERLALQVARSTFKTAVVRTTPLGDCFTTNVPWDDPRGCGFIAYIARSSEAAQSAEVIDGAGDNREIGALYQYPRCCAEGYPEIEDGAYWVEVLARRTTGSRQCAFGNKLAYLFDGTSLFPDYFPCSLSCKETSALGRTYYLLLKKYGMERLAESLHERMCRPLILGQGMAYQLRPSAVRDDLIELKQDAVKRYAWSTDADDSLHDDSVITLHTEGAWIAAYHEGARLGTIFFFDAEA